MVCNGPFSEEVSSNAPEPCLNGADDLPTVVDIRRGYQGNQNILKVSTRVTLQVVYQGLKEELKELYYLENRILSPLPSEPYGVVVFGG